MREDWSVPLFLFLVVLLSFQAGIVLQERVSRGFVLGVGVYLVVLALALSRGRDWWRGRRPRP